MNLRIKELISEYIHTWSVLHLVGGTEHLKSEDS